MNRSVYPPETIKEIAEYLDCGMVCYLNTDTLEVENVLGDSYTAYTEDEYEEIYEEVYEKIENWKNVVRFDPPDSRQSYRIMERFIQLCIPENNPIKDRLWNAISKRKPFQNFKFIIDDSNFRQQWFDFKQSELENLVLEQIT